VTIVSGTKPWCFSSFRSNFSAAALFRHFCTRTSSTFLSMSAARHMNMGLPFARSSRRDAKQNPAGNGVSGCWLQLPDLTCWPSSGRSVSGIDAAFGEYFLDVPKAGGETEYNRTASRIVSGGTCGAWKGLHAGFLTQPIGGFGNKLALD